MSATNNALADAQRVLAGAKDLTKKVEGTPESRFAPKPLNNQYVGTSYSAVQKATKPPKGDTDKTGEAIAAKQKNISEYNAATK